MRDKTKIQIAAIWFVQLNQAICITMPYSIVVFMIRDFLAGTTSDGSEAPSETTIGSRAGFLAATFSFAQFLSSYPWGRASDHIGRKVVVIVGALCTSASVLALGLSTTYASAIGSRFAGGLLNGIIGAVKTIIAEAFDEDAQAHVLGYLSFGWGVGSILGPAFGGFLAQPCDKYGLGAACADDGPLRRHPYLLPCCVAAASALASAAVTAAVLEETLPPERNVLTRLLRGSSPGAGAPRGKVPPGEGATGDDGAKAERAALLAPSVQQDTERAERSGSNDVEELEMTMLRLPQPGHDDSYADAGEGLLQNAENSSLVENGTLRRAADAACPPGDSAVHTVSSSADAPGNGGVKGAKTVSSGGLRNAAAAEVAVSRRLTRRVTFADDVRGGDGSLEADLNPARRTADLTQHVAHPAQHTGGSARSGGALPDYECESEELTGPPEPLGTLAAHWRTDRFDSRGAAVCGEAPATDSAQRAAEASRPAELAADGRQFAGISLAHRAPCAGDAASDEDAEDGCLEGVALLSGRGRSHRAEESAAGRSAGKVCGEKHGSDADSDAPWYHDRQVVLLIAGYGVIALLYNITDEAVPIFASTPVESNGLSLDSSELAVPLSVGGFVLMINATIIYPRARAALGTLRCAKAGLVAMAVIAFLFPCCSLVAKVSPTAAYAALTATVCLRSMSATFAFTSSMIMVNSAAPRAHIGAVNGAGQTLASGVRGIGPALGGTVWSLSLASGVPGHQFVLFALISMLAVGGRLLYRHVTV